MCAGFFKGDFDLPAAHVERYDIQRHQGRVGGQQRDRIEALFWITDQHPANVGRRQTTVIPNRRSGAELDATLGPAIPVLHRPFTPACLRIDKSLLQRREAATFDSRSTWATTWTWWSGF